MKEPIHMNFLNFSLIYILIFLILIWYFDEYCTWDFMHACFSNLYFIFLILIWYFDKDRVWVILDACRVPLAPRASKETRVSPTCQARWARRDSSATRAKLETLDLPDGQV
jgi:hypothetical protein